jgi:hypothetical protein
VSRRTSVGSKAVAIGALTELVAVALERLGGTYDLSEEVPRAELAAEVAPELISFAWDVEYKPTAQRLVVVFDVGVDLTRPEPENAEPASVTPIGRPVADNPQA